MSQRLTPTQAEWASALSLIERVPELDRFLLVDEMTRAAEQLVSEYPSLTSLRQIGSSRLGEPLLSLRVGSGKRNALIFAMPHPNEPVGGLTAAFLARALCEEETLRKGWSWHIIPCIDPDGTRLNERWFHGPFTRTHYARHFYRPAFDDQIEWTFPFAYKRANFNRPQPETVTLMQLIDELRPALMCPLHNSETGGVYYYVSGPAPSLYPILATIPERLGLRLDRGDPEMPEAELYAPAIFGWVRAEHTYDRLQASGLDPANRHTGAASTDYARRYGTFSIVTEVPYWSDDSADNETPTDQRFRELLLGHNSQLADLEKTLRAALAANGTVPILETPYLRAVSGFVQWLGHRLDVTARRAEAPESARLATVAEQRSCEQTAHTFRLRYGGMLLRALDSPIFAGIATHAVREARASLEGTFESWCLEAEAAGPTQTLPIRKLVAVQAGAILAASIYVSRQVEGE